MGEVEPAVYGEFFGQRGGAVEGDIVGALGGSEGEESKIVGVIERGGDRVGVVVEEPVVVA